MDSKTEEFLAEVSDFLLGHGHEAAACEVADYIDEYNQEEAA